MSFETFYIDVNAPINPFPEAIVHRCSPKKVSLNLSQISQNLCFFSILYFTSLVIVYNNYAVQKNILIKIDGVVYSYIVEITNSYKYYTRNKLNSTCTN